MVKNTKWLIKFIGFNTVYEFESIGDFYIYLESKGIYYNFDEYDKVGIPDDIIEEICSLFGGFY